MACATVTMSVGFRYLPLSSSSCTHTRTRVSSYCSARFPLLNNTNSLKLSWSSCISASILPRKLSTLAPHPQTQRLRPLTVVSAKGYKMKTHKASAKRFRVTGRGKIMRRRAGKQHLLYKKSSKRKLRLSKMHPVSKSDYGNVVGALPYLKVNRKGQ